MFHELIKKYPALDGCKGEIQHAAEQWIACFQNGGKLLVCGNGGSCADSEHIVGELMKGFLKKRPLSHAQTLVMKQNCPSIPDKWLAQLQCGLPAVSLTSFSALNSAFCNDENPELVYAQALMGLGKRGDTLLCISTSGNSKNVYAAAAVGKALGLIVVALTGRDGGALKGIADIDICVPETDTFRVQELHLPVYHYLCAVVEDRFFNF